MLPYQRLYLVLRFKSLQKVVERTHLPFFSVERVLRRAIDGQGSFVSVTQR
jgi:hypothetical protein